MKRLTFIHDESDHPYEQGYSLGLNLLRYKHGGEVQIDMTGTPAWVINRNFFYGILMALKHYDIQSIPKARNINWLFSYEFQVDLARSWMHDIDVCCAGSVSVGKRPNTQERKKQIAKRKRQAARKGAKKDVKSGIT